MHVFYRVFMLKQLERIFKGKYFISLFPLDSGGSEKSTPLHQYKALFNSINF